MAGCSSAGNLRWDTPLKGLLVGVSRMNEYITGRGSANFFGISGPYEEHSINDWTNQYYGQYTRGRLEIDSEYRRYWRDQRILSGLLEVGTDVRGMYVSGSYRPAKWFQAGSYYSRYSINIPVGSVGGVPEGHTYDKVVSGRFDINRFFNVKIEGHFMDGIGVPGMYPDGFYAANNPQGLKPDTKALVVKTGFNF
jgi:hypothetical protein